MSTGPTDGGEKEGRAKRGMDRRSLLVGGAVGAGVSVPREAVFVRRWSIQPLPADPANGLVLQIVATRVTQPAAREVHLVSILARTAR